MAETKRYKGEVESWFTNLISDDDVLRSTKIEINILAKIVEQTGATVDSFEAFFGKGEHHRKTMLDIGVLRFPNIDRPFFKLYRIKLEMPGLIRPTFFSTRTIRTVLLEVSHPISRKQDSELICGANAEYNARNFVPSESVMTDLIASARQKAIDTVNHLLDD